MIRLRYYSVYELYLSTFSPKISLPEDAATRGDNDMDLCNIYPAFLVAIYVALPAFGSLPFFMALLNIERTDFLTLALFTTGLASFLFPIFVATSRMSC